MTDDTKPWYASLTLWSLVGAVVLLYGRAVARRYGIAFDEGENGTIDLLISGLIGVAGFGRVRATKQIGPKDLNAQ